MGERKTDRQQLLYGPALSLSLAIVLQQGFRCWMGVWARAFCASKGYSTPPCCCAGRTVIGSRGSPAELFLALAFILQLTGVWRSQGWAVIPANTA